MKRTWIITIMVHFLTWLGGANAVWAQTLPASGDWTATTVTTQTVDLTGDVTIKGQITIPEDVTLTINGEGQTITPYTIVNPKDENGKNAQGPVSFQVRGKLIIKGTSGQPVIIDGGNGTNGQITVGNNYNGGGEAAISAGTDFTRAGIVINVVEDAVIDLDHVKAVNLYANAYSEVGSLVTVKTHTKDNKNRSKVYMDNVTIDNCYNDNGAGVILAAGANVKTDIVMNHCVITNSMSKAYGTGRNYGGVIKGSGSTDCNLTMDNCTMSYCWGSGWGGAILWASNIGGCKAELNNCIFSHNYARYLGGALSTEAVMELTGCVISNNIAGFGGGGIAAFPFTLTEDTSSKQAVGLVLKTGNTITENKTMWVNNKDAATSTSPLYNALYKIDEAGNLQSMGDDKQVDYGFNPRYTIAGATDVYYPSGGGGIWVLMNKDLWSCELEIGEGNTISNNHSAYDGGGVFLYKQRPYTKTSAADVTFIEDYNYSYKETQSGTTINVPNSGLTSMVLSSNIVGNTSAHSGGGAAVGSDVTGIATTWTFPNVTVTGGSISENKALDGNGGGVYMPGGIFTISDGSITNNQAQIGGELSFIANASGEAGNGGGISITNGTFTIEKTDFVISGNQAARYGGGLFVNDAKDDVTFSGGTFRNNIARAGGGMAFEGNDESEHKLFMKANLISNEAINGGGIYLNNHASMEFQGGMILKNLASSAIPSNSSFQYSQLDEKTAWHKHVNEVEGVGGGIFMDDFTTLSFNIEGKNLGLYNNRATAAADDIFANGNNTSVTLPDVSDMNLQNFEGAAGRLFWAEDYYSYYEGDNSFQHDAKYLSDGINKVQLSDPDGNLRYQFALGQKRRNHIQEVKPMEYTNYVCLVLGYEIFYVNIIKEGLKEGESAMFHIYEATMADGSATAAIPADAKPYMSMLLTGGEVKDGKVYRTVALPGGHWGVRENDWSYTYQSVEGSAREQVREITVDDDISKNEGFLFINQEKESKSSILHDEAKAKNIMGKEQ